MVHHFLTQQLKTLQALNKSLYENGNGGNLIVLNNDIITTNALYTDIYIRLFGGNRITDTKQGTSADFWGNKLLSNNEKPLYSKTEYTLLKVLLTSTGLSLIKKAVESDLKEYKSYISSIDVYCPVKNKININIYLKSANTITITWDATIKEEVMTWQ